MWSDDKGGLAIRYALGAVKNVGPMQCPGLLNYVMPMANLPVYWIFSNACRAKSATVGRWKICAGGGLTGCTTTGANY